MDVVYERDWTCVEHSILKTGSDAAPDEEFKRLLAMGHEARQAKLQRQHMERIAAYEDSTGLKYEEPDEEDRSARLPHIALYSGKLFIVSHCMFFALASVQSNACSSIHASVHE